jgi:hypothetical protein
MNHGIRHTPVEAVKAAIDELHRAGLMRTDEHGAVWIDDLSD